MDENMIIQDIGEYIDYNFEFLPDVTSLEPNKIIAQKKFADCARLYNTARYFYITAMMYEEKHKELDDISIEYNKMIYMQTSAMWLNAAVDVLFQFDWFYDKIYERVKINREIGVKLSNINFDDIIKSCNLSQIQNNSHNEHILSIAHSRELDVLRQRIVNELKHRGVIYSENLERKFSGVRCGFKYTDADGNYTDNTVFDEKLISFEDLSLIVRSVLKLFKNQFEIIRSNIL